MYVSTLVWPESCKATSDDAILEPKCSSISSQTYLFYVSHQLLNNGCCKPSIFIQSGAGHYDYAVPIPPDEDTTQVSKSKVLKCTCGRKNHFTGKACSTNRCPCLRSKQQCSSSCRCKACENTLGSRPPPSSIRRRIVYDSQRQPLHGHTGASFLKVVGESSVHGRLTLYEVLVLKTIIIYLMLHGMSVTAENIVRMYKKVVALVLLNDTIEFGLSDIEEEQIHYFLRHLNISLELLRNVFLK